MCGRMRPYEGQIKSSRCSEQRGPATRVEHRVRFTTVREICVGTTRDEAIRTMLQEGGGGRPAACLREHDEVRGSRRDAERCAVALKRGLRHTRQFARRNDE